MATGRTVNQDWLDAYYILYGMSDQLRCRYGVNREKVDISLEDAEEIKEMLQNCRNSQGEIDSFYFRAKSGASYWITMYRKGNAAVAMAEGLDKYGRTAFADMKWVESVQIRDGENPGMENTGPGGKTYGLRIGSSQIWLVCRTDSSMMMALSAVEIFLLAVTLVSVLAVFFMYRLISRVMVKPMYALMDVMKQARRGSIEQIPDLQMPFYELELVNTVLKKMVDEIRSQRMKYYEEKLSRQEAELQFLQMQLNPHFYLNCLKTLNTMAVDAGMESMQELILKISEYLRYLLQSERKTIELGEELEFTRNYVELQRILSDRKIVYEVLMEENVKKWLIPVLSIQTFVENSIKYVKMDLVRKQIEIHIQINRLQLENGEEMLDITVQDCGQGYPDELLPVLNRRDCYDTCSVGIANLKRRCNLLYGEKAEYTFYNLDGAVSEIVIPHREIYTAGENGNENIGCG